MSNRNINVITPIVLNNNPLKKEARKKHIKPTEKINRRCLGLDILPKISIITAEITAPIYMAVPKAPSEWKNFIINIAGAVTINPWANPFNNAN